MLNFVKLNYEYHAENDNNVGAFVFNKLKGAKAALEIKPKDVVLYGFGRISSVVAHELMSRTGKGNQLRIRAIVLRENLKREILEKKLVYANRLYPWRI